MLRTTIFAMVTMASFCLSPITQANESQEAKAQATSSPVTKKQVTEGRSATLQTLPTKKIEGRTATLQTLPGSKQD